MLQQDTQHGGSDGDEDISQAMADHATREETSKQGGMGDYIKQEVFMGLRCFIQATAIDAASAEGWETLLEDYLSTTIDTQEWVKTSVVGGREVHLDY